MQGGFVCRYMWKSEIDTGCLPQLHSTLIFETLFLTETVVQDSAIVVSKVQGSSCFHSYSPGVIDVCHHVWLLYGHWVSKLENVKLTLIKLVVYELSHLPRAPAYIP